MWQLLKKFYRKNILEHRINRVIRRKKYANSYASGGGIK